MRGQRERDGRVCVVEADAFAGEACNRGRVAADAIGAERVDGDQKYVERAARRLAARRDEECGDEDRGSFSEHGVILHDQGWELGGTPIIRIENPNY